MGLGVSLTSDMSASSSSSDKRPSSSFTTGSAGPISSCAPSCVGSSERSDKVQLSRDCRQPGGLGAEGGKGNEGPRRRRIGDDSTGGRQPRSGRSSVLRLPSLDLFGWGGLTRGGGGGGGVFSLLESSSRAPGALADLAWFRPRPSSSETNCAHASASGVISPVLGPQLALVGVEGGRSGFDHQSVDSLRSPGLFGDLGMLADRFGGLARSMGSMARAASGWIFVVHGGRFEPTFDWR